MPNIKVCGLNKKDYDILFKKIQDLFKDQLCADDVVVTRAKTETHDLKKIPRPYIQLELDCMNNYQSKIDLIKKLKMDIQVVKLHEFIEAESDAT